MPGLQKTFSELSLNQAAPPETILKMRGLQRPLGSKGEDHVEGIKEGRAGQDSTRPGPAGLAAAEDASWQLVAYRPRAGPSQWG